ncbi:MAG: hypothetical protein QOJ42_4617, partial [Acidobacteriaceae bacterium]|nr:hypothetical protein [Acidobacteriaceae bacterium]
MYELTTVAFYGVQRSLADHWGLIFTGRMPAAMMKDFLAQLRVEVLFPDLLAPSAEDPLEGILIRAATDNAASTRAFFRQFKAQDSRFEVSRPVVFL